MRAALLSVAFDFSLDDLADVSMRYSYGMGVGLKERRRWIWKRAAGTAAVAMLVFVVLGRTRDASSLLGMAFTAVVVGGASIGHYAYYYDARIKQRMLRELATEYGTETMRCQVELRRDGTWVRQINDENTYAWKDFLQLTDSDLGVELWFRNGYLLIRPRAFPTPADRADFVSTARSLAREALAPVVS